MGDILFIGGDRRMICAAELISQSGGVCAVGLGGDFPEPENQSDGYERIVLPVPFSRDGENITAPLSERPLPLELLTDYAAAGARIFSGGTSTKLEALCETHGLQLVNYMAAEELTLKNALLTAEGAVSLLISGYDGALFDSTAVITGYGRIARYLARLLQAFRCRVTIAARSPLQREAALLDGLCTLPVTLARNKYRSRVYPDGGMLQQNALRRRLHGTRDPLGDSGKGVGGGSRCEIHCCGRASREVLPQDSRRSNRACCHLRGAFVSACGNH